MKYLACVEWVKDGSGNDTDTCLTQAWVEQPTVLPPLSISEAQTIGQALLLALASVMAIKVAMRKSQ